MRPLAILLATLAIALSPPALAQPDKGNPPGPAEKAGTDGPPGPAANANTDGPPKQAKKDDKPEPPGHAKKGAPPPSHPSTAEELDAVKDAIAAHEALPLAQIVAVAQERSTGHVIDVQLVRISGALLYQLTMLDSAGRSWRELYYARTGNPVVIR